MTGRTRLLRGRFNWGMAGENGPRQKQVLPFGKDDRVCFLGRGWLVGDGPAYGGLGDGDGGGGVAGGGGG